MSAIMGVHNLIIAPLQGRTALVDTAAVAWAMSAMSGHGRRIDDTGGVYDEMSAMSAMMNDMGGVLVT